MRHRSSAFAFALALLAIALAGCQDYPFSPVKGCIIQPGSRQVAIPRLSSADVLFVVDDSGSMAGKQAKLSSAFDAFVSSLNAYNDLRATNHLEPFDFHVAITTTSVFYNQPTSATCKATCGSSTNVCGTVNGGTCSPMRNAKACPAGTGCGAGYSCKATCTGHAGELTCCDASGVNIETTTIACTAAEVATNTACGQIQERYAFDRRPKTCASSATCASGDTCTTATNACGAYPGSLCCKTTSCTTSADCASGYACGSCEGKSNICCAVAAPNQPQGTPELLLACNAGVGQDGALYPQGDFVGVGTNPRVLHFDKSLYASDANGDGFWDPVPNKSTATNHQSFTRGALKTYFEQNVNVGTCGSGQEQGLEAARLAVSKALSGQQFDIRNSSGQPVALPGVAAEWPHASGKLVVVYVGDEDDCSSPADPVRGVILSGAPPADACWADGQLPLDQQKEFRVADFVTSLQALGRPLGAAFVVSATDVTCQDATCSAAVCAPDQSCLDAGFPAAQCGGIAPGSRFLLAGTELRAGGADVIDASICNSDFGSILGRIAEIVKPPSAMTLPTQPASAAMTLLRITNASGATRKLCRGPALPPLTATQAAAAGYDWWFTATSDQNANKDPSEASRYIYVNHATLQCEPNPGEGYSTDYLGVVPAAGCTSDAACTSALGGSIEWTCYAGVTAGGACIAPTASAPGTCVCNSRATVCPNG